MRTPNYDKFPFVQVPGGETACVQGWADIATRLREAIVQRAAKKTVVVVECYTGVDEASVIREIQSRLTPVLVVNAADAMLEPEKVDALVAPFLGGNDPVFGFLCGLTLPQFFNLEKLGQLRAQIAAITEGLVLVVGCGASLIAEPDILVYADLARWEAQLRFRRNEISNLGVENRTLAASLQYKRAFFVDWRVCDRWKRPLIAKWDFVLDTNNPQEPKLAEGEAVRRGLRHAVTRPFRVVPFFDTAPWGGQWMKEVCDLDRDAKNFGWCFDCVPEENSLLLGFGDKRLEMPSLDLVFDQPRALLGDAVHARFGDEFPIRFDFLDTMGGGNLSFQVHPLTEYIQHHFGMHYTQDESYYLLDAGAGANVYLGLKDGVDPAAMTRDLQLAQSGTVPFPAEKYANQFPAKKHDHFLIPAGTVHCSGAESMVLEISATPYIFTFKMWDWDRLGLDGKPRPIHLEHGLANIQWDCTTEWTQNNLVNRIESLGSGDGWREERTGLHTREFIETRRHWFTKAVLHDTCEAVNVLNLVEGKEALVESPTNAFEPFVVHYAETFIVPAAVGQYTIRPHGPAEGRECATLKAFVRPGSTKFLGRSNRKHFKSTHDPKPAGFNLNRTLNVVGNHIRKLASLFLIASSVLGTSLNAGELLNNGSFELPTTDDLSQDFQLNQQAIPGWEFSGGSVSVVNHTRLFPGDGFQSLLLPCSANESSAIRQKFNVATNGPVRISFKLAASKAVDGDIEITLDGNAIKTIQLSKFWKPEEIALTDQMKWRLVTLPEIQMTPGEHALGFRVLKFQPRSDRQGDNRSSIQGVLIDAVSVQSKPFDKPATDAKKRAWPVEKKVKYAATRPLPLDGVAGPWVSTRTLACYPSLANFYGALRSTKELGGIQYLHFTGVGQADGVLDAISLDGQPVFCDESRWYPYQVRTRTQAGPLDIEATTRMVFANHGVLTRFALTNQSDQPVVRTLEMNLQSAQTVGCPDPHTVVIPGSLPRAYYFKVAPDKVIATNGTTLAQWKISLPPKTGQEISLALTIDKTPELAVQNAQDWGKDFGTAFAAAKTDWEKRWEAVFTPDNTIYSGCLPTLETDDQSLRELYYLSIASMLETERYNFPAFKQCFVGEDPEWGGDVTWFWDYSLTSLPYVLLNPAVMKTELCHWLTIDWKTCSHFSLHNGKPDGSWYAVNPYAYFISLDRYLTVTGDFAFLSEKVNGRTVLDYMEDLAMDWKRLVPKDGKLLDIGGNPWNMLEAPPNYIHGVASINAQSVWIMRRLAEYQTRLGNLKRADELRAEADALVPELLKLYNPKTGSWNVLYPDGRQIDSRHIYDYLTIGTTISDDLEPKVKTVMMDFVDRELMTKTWMRAMSRQDPSAFDSDRSDHGPAGSFSGWPAKAAQATAELGNYDKALDMFHRFRNAFDSAIPQAIELTKVEGQEGLQARVSSRAGASFAEVSGSFAEVIINTFFGFRPAPDEKIALWNPGIPRGFNGLLRHVRWNGGLYTITSDKHDLRIEKE